MQTETGTDIEKAALLLKSGNLVAIPTETVYGLAANALDDDAVLKIYRVKQRPQFNPLIIHTSSLERVRVFVKQIPPQAQVLASHFWPGPLTLLLTKAQPIPELVTAGSSRVAVRVPQHPLTLRLLDLLDFPVAAPSANPSGYVSPTSAAHVIENLEGKISYILDGGACRVGLESTILGWDEQGRPEIYRHGGITTEAIEAVLHQTVPFKMSSVGGPETPGQLKSHYATRTPLHLGSMETLLTQFSEKNVLLINFKNYVPGVPQERQFILAPSGTPEEAAKNLFSILRAADEKKATAILAETIPNYGLGMAVNDRLQRAQFILK
jgi:L-threonylcarbamoyladenylate synthase